MLDRRHLLLSLGAAALARPTLAQRSDRLGQPTRFSDAALGKTAPGHWRHQPLPKVERSNEFAIVAWNRTSRAITGAHDHRCAGKAVFPREGFVGIERA